MKSKNFKKSKQTLKIKVYERIVIELLSFITNSGLKAPSHLLHVIEALIPETKRKEETENNGTKEEK